MATRNARYYRRSQSPWACGRLSLGQAESLALQLFGGKLFGAGRLDAAKELVKLALQAKGQPDEANRFASLLVKAGYDREAARNVSKSFGRVIFDNEVMGAKGDVGRNAKRYVPPKDA